MAINSAPREPQENGLVERAMQGIKKAISIAIYDKLSWKNELRDYVAAYNSWPHSVTRIPPADLIMGRRVRGKFPLFADEECGEWLVNEEVRDRDAVAKESRNSREDKKRGAKNLKISMGDSVIVWDFDKRGKMGAHYLNGLWSVIDVVGSRVVVRRMKRSEDGSWAIVPLSAGKGSNSNDVLIRKRWAVKKFDGMKSHPRWEAACKFPAIVGGTGASTQITQIPVTRQLRKRAQVNYRLLNGHKVHEVECGEEQVLH